VQDDRAIAEAALMREEESARQFGIARMCANREDRSRWRGLCAQPRTGWPDHGA
jgi:hypothetical protein